MQACIALVRRPDVLLTGFNYDIGPAPIWLGLTAALMTGVAVFRTSPRRRLGWLLFWATAVPFAVLGSILAVTMFFGRETSVITYFLGWSLLSSAVIFLLLWAARAVLVLVRSGLTAHQLSTNIRKGFDGGLVAVALAWTVALFAGGNLFRLVALNGFYALLMPTVLGIGVALPQPTRQASWFALTSVVLAACMAFYTVPWPFVERHWIECQWWFPAGQHEVFGFHDEPWHWRTNGILTWLTAPGALGELTIRNIAQPLTELICAAPDDDAPWSNYGM